MEKVREPKIVTFLRESNKIEGEYSEEALRDALTAWHYAEADFSSVRLSLLDVLMIHEELMMYLNNEIAGRLRNCSVSIGGKIKYFISITLLEEQVNNWCDKWWHRRDLTEEELKQSHVEFEEIHPFEDGNGRVGRILYNIMRLRNGYGIHIIHEGEEQMEYYKWFK